MGMVFEWDVHNVVYYATQIAKDVGIPTETVAKYEESARSVNLGSSIYHDKHEYSFVMWAVYTGFFPFNALYDGVIYAKSVNVVIADK